VRWLVVGVVRESFVMDGFVATFVLGMVGRAGLCFDRIRWVSWVTAAVARRRRWSNLLRTQDPVTAVEEYLGKSCSGLCWCLVMDGFLTRNQQVKVLEEGLSRFY
jgi:hypothetical protein